MRSDRLLLLLLTQGNRKEGGKEKKRQEEESGVCPSRVWVKKEIRIVSNAILMLEGATPYCRMCVCVWEKTGRQQQHLRVELQLRAEFFCRRGFQSQFTTPLQPQSSQPLDWPH